MFDAYGEWVLIEQPMNEREEHGIVVPDGMQGRETPPAEVVSVGKDVEGLAAGDKVLVAGGHYGGFELDGRKVLAISPDKIIAVLRDVN